jgi:hypothetical protein
MVVVRPLSILACVLVFPGGLYPAIYLPACLLRLCPPDQSLRLLTAGAGQVTHWFKRGALTQQATKLPGGKLGLLMAGTQIARLGINNE